MNVYADAASLAYAAAQHFTARADEAVAARGRFVVALAGGATPRLLYTLLATDEFAARVAWSRVHAFWGDERCVPADHPESNYHMANDILLRHVPILASNVHRIRTDLGPQRAAADYERTLRTYFSGRPVGDAAVTDRPVVRFDLVILGMGDDGHTASLFPGSAALRERQRLVVACFIQKLGAWRITLTPIALNAAAQVVFLVTGSGKAERLREVLAGPYQPDTIPAQIIRPSDGCLLWMVDQAAGAEVGGH